MATGTAARPAHSRDESGLLSSSGPTRGIEGETRQYGDPDRKPGPLLDDDKRRAAKENYRLFMSRESEMDRRMAQWEVNEFRRAGTSEARLLKDQDRWMAWVPRWHETDPERGNTMNKAARICRRMSSQMFADPPAPEAIPASGEDEDADAAEVATRVLIDLQSEGALDDIATLRHAFDLASTYDSGFIRYYVDPRGGGKRPIEVEAGYDPGVTEEEAMLAWQSGDLSVMPSPPREAETFMDAEIDPTTNARWPHYQKRFVRADGSLTEDRGEAATRWVPTLESEVLTGKNVRLIPHTALNVSKARGVQIGFYETWGNLKEVNPELAKLAEEERNELLRFRPKQNADRYLPYGTDRKVLDHRGKEEEDRDEVKVFCIITYYRACDEYPDGLYLWTAGDSHLVVRDDWIMEDEGQQEPLLIPVVQVKQFQEGTTDTFGKGLMTILGSANDLRGQQLASFLDYLEWIENRKGFIPTTSNLRGADMEGAARWLRTIPGGAPSFEEIPPYPEMGVEMFKLTGDEMDEDSGLGPLGDNLLDAESGRQAYAAVSQAHAGLSEPRQNVASAYVRACRIQLQMLRAFFDRDQTVRWLGEDNRFKVENWSVSDLRTTKDVRLAPGTLTGLTPAQKTQLLEHYAEMGPEVMPPLQLREALAANLGGTIALQDDPPTNRIRGQLSEWSEGPPEGWQGTPEGDTLDPAWGMFEPVESDTDPEIAATRYREIKNFMQTHRYRRWPKAWRQVVIVEYQRMGEASGAMQPQQQPAGPTQEEAPALAPGANEPEQPMPFGISPPDTVPPEVAGALPPEQAGIPGANVGEMPVEVTRGA